MKGLLNGALGFTFKEMPADLHCPILVDGSSNPNPKRLVSNFLSALTELSKAPTEIHDPLGPF